MIVLHRSTDDFQKAILFRRLILHRQQVLQQPGVLVHDGQRVVYLVGHPRGHPAYGGHLVRVFDVVKRLLAPAIGFPDPAHQVP